MTLPSSSRYQHLKAASEWFAILSDESVTEEEKKAWQAWLDESDEHYEAWQEVESVSGMFASFESQEKGQSAYQVLSSSHARTMSRRHLMKGVMGLAGLAALGWIGWQKTSLPSLAASWTADLHTKMGQMKSYALLDGSTIWLNTNSAVNRHFSSSARHFSLVNGEVQVEVTSHQDPRPFSISCECGVIGAKQARFNLRHLSEGEAVVAVFDGQVTLAPSDLQTARTILAGEQVHFTKRSISPRTPALALYDSWVEGLLVVDNMSLRRFTEELERYRFGYINLDPSVENLRIVGTFPAQDPDIVLSMLTKSLPIKINRPLPFWISIDAA